jgi:membrane protease YdiL (CAAX protease family)
MSTGIVLVPLALALARRIAPRRGVFFARWGFLHVLVLVGAGAVLLNLTPLIVPGDTVDPWILIARTMVFMGGLALGVLAIAHRMHPEGIGALGFSRGGNLRAIAAGLVCFVLLWPVLTGCMWAWPMLARLMDLEVGVQPVLEGILDLEGSALFGALVFAVLIGPLLEELIFRGFLQPLLVQNFRERGGIAMCAFLFALLHGVDAFLPLFMFSLLLGWLQVHTQRLLASYCVHALNNGVTMIIAFTVGL